MTDSDMYALRRLLNLLTEGGQITNASDSPMSTNGLPYYSVEITFGNGTQYAIQAYGEEANLIHEEVMKYLAYKRLQKSKINGPP